MSHDYERAGEFRERASGANVELPYAGLDTFLKGRPADVEDVGDADAAVIGVPYDNAVSNRPGARYGPNAVREASAWWAYLSGYKDGLTNMRTEQQVDYSQFDVVDAGDAPVFPMDHEKTAESIRAHAATIAEQTFPVLVGGDHFCTWPSFEGFAMGAGHDSVGLVQIDAHTDTAEGSPVFGEDFHGSSTHHIATGDYGSFDSVSQIGIRGYESPDFFEFADDTGLNLFTMNDVDGRGIAAVAEDAVEAAAADTDAVYVTFDIDGVDPSVAPGTGTPESGGLSAHQALAVMETLGGHDAVGAVDLMEVSPPFDPEGSTARLGAYLLVTLLERTFAE
ncbi:agmatinase [Halarchaeum acidiphilum MH1-52-1]|uniref:Agmatinase n=1 Tax=Halarchaeum acidiphilum MH1-52-1 TaxID=1261545 RepID=U2YS74_9EURY|nr:agmatinase family protein [Halarchaeum acidiphilum]GAD51830.1 agmatinase [Halarchaeum acidiphilum MH1-52-1]